MSKLISAPVVMLRPKGMPAAAPPSSSEEMRNCGVVQGTMIGTAAGPKPVEQIRRGDFVRVFFRHGLQFEPVEWVGKRTVILSKVTKASLPVRVRPHAIADGRPSRDLYLAPGHAMYYEGKRYRIGDLINGASIISERGWKSATYWGLKLRRHNVIYADGMLVETILGGHAGLFEDVLTQSDSENATVKDEAARGCDIAAEVSYVLQMIRPMLVQAGARVDLAARDGLRASLPATMARGLLLEMLVKSVQAAPGQRLLLTVVGGPNRTHVRITSEDRADSQIVQDDLADVQALAALNGASLLFDVLPEGQISLTLSLIVA